MRHLDLFSGIGGFALAAQWMGWQTIQFVEIDPFCQAVLKKNFNGVPIHGDIKQFDGKPYRGAIDILTGGFPCQPLSVSGKMLGKNDVRWLWREMFRVADEVRPTFIVPENVPGLHRYLDEILSDLESIGYQTEPISVEAACVGADHIRERYWPVAYSLGRGSQKGLPVRVETEYASYGNIFKDEARYSSYYEREIESMRVGAYNGISNRMDRIKSLGNAIVPQVAFEIFKAIEGTLTSQRNLGESE